MTHLQRRAGIPRYLARPHNRLEALARCLRTRPCLAAATCKHGCPRGRGVHMHALYSLCVPDATPGDQGAAQDGHPGFYQQKQSTQYQKTTFFRCTVCRCWSFFWPGSGAEPKIVDLATAALRLPLLLPALQVCVAGGAQVVHAYISTPLSSASQVFRCLYKSRGRSSTLGVTDNRLASWGRTG